MTIKEVENNCKEGWNINYKIADKIIKRLNICNEECPCHNDSYDKHCPCSDYREKDICYYKLYIR